jgi:hypothetical protein
MEDIAPTLETLTAGQETLISSQDSINTELRERLHNLETMMRAMCVNAGIAPATLGLHIPEVPPFSPSPGPTSATPSVISAVSTASSNTRIRPMSIGDDQIAGPSETVTGKAKVQGTSGLLLRYAAIVSN